jgi:hypothetical protein
MRLFRWNQIDASSDLQRLRLVLEAMPDEELMRTLERERKGRRDDYPIRAVWNSVLAGVIYGHAGIESLRRELLRNRELLEVCGFDPVLGARAVPPSWVYTRLVKKLCRHLDLMERMVDELVDDVAKQLPDLGRRLAVDSKGIRTHARGRKDPAESADPEADWGVRTYRQRREDGSVVERVKRWFGYKLHLLVDVDYEMPVAYRVTRASANDSPVLGELLEDVESKHEAVLERAQFLSMDKAYDSQDNNATLYDVYGIKPLIPTRELWKDEEAPGGLRQLRHDVIDNVLYDEQGTLYCSCPVSGEVRQMLYWGLEEERRCLKYRCPAAHYGIACAGRSRCSPTQYGRVVRISLDDPDIDRRLFVPVPRHTLQFKREYKKRTAIERVNSRLGLQLGFDVHFVRGMTKMKMKAGLAIAVMLSMAVAQVRRNHKGKMRTLLAA